VRTFTTYVITCSSHVFTNFEATNHELSICYWHFLIYFDSQIKNHLELIKTNGKFGEKKSGFVVSGFVKTCDELVISWENGYLFISSSARILIIFYTFLISLSDEL